VATFLVWGVIEYVHIRFRQALKVQGQSVESLPFKALWYPYGTYFALAANIFLVFFQGIYYNFHFQVTSILSP
jgi:yeast amino acid transporter